MATQKFLQVDAIHKSRLKEYQTTIVSQMILNWSRKCKLILVILDKYTQIKIQLQTSGTICSTSSLSTVWLTSDFHTMQDSLSVANCFLKVTFPFIVACSEATLSWPSQLIKVMMKFSAWCICTVIVIAKYYDY